MKRNYNNYKWEVFLLFPVHYNYVHCGQLVVLWFNLPLGTCHLIILFNYLNVGSPWFWELKGSTKQSPKGKDKINVL